MVITEENLSGLTGLGVLAAMHGRDPQVPVVVLAAQANLDAALTAIRLGAYDYVRPDQDTLPAWRHRVRRALEERRLRQDNQRLVAHLRDVNAFKGQLLRSVSHDFVNLLTVIQGYGGLARIAAVADRNECFERILSAAAMIKHMAEDLSTYAQMDAVGLQLNVRPVSVRQCAEEAMTAVLHDTRTHPIRLPAEDAAVLADPLRLEQILVNLLTNAVKYSPDGGAIHIECRRDGERVRVGVRDEGAGIPAEEIPQLTQPFYRMQRDVDRDVPGTGLGLAIVRSLAEALGSSLECASRVGEGTTFSLLLPSAGNEARQPEPQRCAEVVA